jgi:hypothetical protein
MQDASKTTTLKLEEARDPHELLTESSFCHSRAYMFAPTSPSRGVETLSSVKSEKDLVSVSTAGLSLELALRENLHNAAVFVL